MCKRKNKHGEKNLRIKQLAEEKGATPAQISLAWMLANIPMSQVFGGSKIQKKCL